MPSIRIQRLERVIKERVSSIVLYELKDPRVGFTTITKVKLAKDLSVATVFYSVLGNEGQKKRTQEALQHAAGMLQREVGRVMQTVLTPHLEFRFDESVEGMIRVGKILDEVSDEMKRKEQAAAAAAAAASDAAPEAPAGDDREDATVDEHDGDGGTQSGDRPD